MIGFGIIGGGMISRFHAEAIRTISEAKLIGIFGRNDSKTKAISEEYDCIQYETLDALIGDSSISAVSIATPSGAHLEPCIAAAMAGKHIICEKPLEINDQRINQIIDVCQENDVVLSGIFNRRFNPAVEALKSAIDSKRFGKLALCSTYIKWYRDQDYYDGGTWRGTKELDGGGALMNQSIHTIDLLQYLAGPIERLSGSVDCITHKNIEVEDNAVAILQFENRAIGVIEASTSCWSKEGHPAEIHICGSEGSAFLKDDKFSVWEFLHKRPEDDLIKKNLMDSGGAGLGANDPGAINMQGHVENFKDFIQAIYNQKDPLISGKEALKSVQIINAIYQSSESGKWVDLK